MNKIFNDNDIIKYIIYFIMSVFIISIILIIILLFGYYLTPNNYEIFKYENIINDLKFIEEKKIILEKNKKIKFNIKKQKSNITNYYYNFDKETHLIIGNLIKSQNVILTKNDFLKIKYNSEIDIINNTENELKLKVKIYIN